ncbi:HEPN domain-containing protein [Shinella sp.]|uniref:HEPN domain-containing protein n=1 Tax=Shinella sp. TaxID=1870904 RepID=UPI00301C01DE
MSSRLIRTEFAYSGIKQHLEEASGGGAIASYLVQYLVISLYAEMEEHVAQIIKDRLHFNGDKKLERFVFTTNEGMIKRVKKSDIAEVLQKFGMEKEEILGDVTEADVGYYSTAIAHRHNVAHKQGAPITISQFENALDAAEKILASLEKCIR